MYQLDRFCSEKRLSLHKALLDIKIVVFKIYCWFVLNFTLHLHILQYIDRHYVRLNIAHFITLNTLLQDFILTLNGGYKEMFEGTTCIHLIWLTSLCIYRRYCMKGKKISGTKNNISFLCLFNWYENTCVMRTYEHFSFFSFG